jgi:hypothetical protein
VWRLRGDKTPQSPGSPLARLSGRVADRPLRHRLASVANYMAPRVFNKFEDDLVLKEQMLDIFNWLSYVQAGPDDDGNIDATVKRLTDEEACSIANDIVSLVFSEMRRLEGNKP